MKFGKSLAVLFLTLFSLSSLRAQIAGSPAVEQPNGTAHSTTLSWTAGAAVTGVTVSGYNVYKSSTSGGESGTTAINGTTLVTTTTYVDSNVTPGATAYYVVEAQSSTGNQSKPSNEVSATTPSNPSAPTLSATIVSEIINKGTETIVAQYTEQTKGTETAYELWGGGRLLVKGTPAIVTNGNYTVTWKGAPVAAASLTVADSTGQVATTE